MQAKVRTIFSHKGNANQMSLRVHHLSQMAVIKKTNSWQRCGERDPHRLLEGM
jgi:hypothetical protein